MFFSNFPFHDKPKNQADFDGMVAAYERALFKYSDPQLLGAGSQCVETLTRFPLPGDLARRIDTTEGAHQDGKHAYAKAYCSKCGKWRYCCKDIASEESPNRHPQYECEDCYTGLTREERIQRVRDFTKTLKGGLFKSMDEAA